MTDVRQTTTNYVHPTDPNLLNIHKAMKFNADGQPVVRTHVDGITLEGDVIVDAVRLWDGTDYLDFEAPNNDGETGQASLPAESYNMVFNGSTWDRMRGTTTTGVLVNVSNATLAVTQSTNPWTITGTVAINSIPEVEVKNDSGKPLPISANTNTNSNTNPLYVISIDQPAANLSAFEEPMAVGITPVIQADCLYGLDPDVWETTTINNSTVTTLSSVWSVASGTSANGFARLRTSRFVRYQPGQGMLGRWTAAFTVSSGTGTNSIGVTNAPQTAGILNLEDGYAFGFSGLTGTDSYGADKSTFGLLHRYAGRVEIRTLTITQQNTGAQTATVTLDGVAYTVSLAISSSPTYAAAQIATLLRTNSTLTNTWAIDNCADTITFSYYTTGPRNGTFSFSSSGTGTPAAGTFVRTTTGVAPTEDWTYISKWNGTLPTNFDPSKLNVFSVDFRWLGAGRVRFFIEDPVTGKMVLVHTQTWTSQYLTPHIIKPSLRLTYNSGPTDGTTPAQNAIVRGASVFGGIQGTTVQTNHSQGYSFIDSSSRAKDTVWHLMSIQNPYVRGGQINNSQILIQALTVAAQANDPSIIYIVVNPSGTSDYLLYNPIPNADQNFVFAQVSNTAVSETLSNDVQANVQTLGINGSATFNLMDYRFSLAPGDSISVFISSSNAITRTSTGMTWVVD